MLLPSKQDQLEDGDVIYTPRIWHRFAKKWVYPKRSRVFRIVIRRKKKRK